MDKLEVITLHNVTGFSRKSGIDINGNFWEQFEVDYLAEQEDGECAICHAVLTEGWMCLDGGDEVCSRHIRFPTWEPMEVE